MTGKLKLKLFGDHKESMSKVILKVVHQMPNWIPLYDMYDMVFNKDGFGTDEKKPLQEEESEEDKEEEKQNSPCITDPKVGEV